MELKTSFGVQDALEYRTLLAAVTTYILFSFSPTFDPHLTHIHAHSLGERSPSPRAADGLLDISFPADDIVSSSRPRMSLTITDKGCNDNG